MNEITNEQTANNTEPNKLSPIRRKWLAAQYRRMISLVPHGKHKNQKGVKGAFGKAKRLVRK